MTIDADLGIEIRDAYVRQMRQGATDEGKLGRRWAGMLVEIAGPAATEEALAEAAAGRFSRMDPVRRDALVAYAHELLHGRPAEGAMDDRANEGSAETIRRREELTMAQRLTPEQRVRAHHAAREALAADPNAKAESVREALAREGIEISRNNWMLTYWKSAIRALGRGNGGAPGKTKPKPEAAPAAASNPAPRIVSGNQAGPAPEVAPEPAETVTAAPEPPGGVVELRAAPEPGPTVRIAIVAREVSIDVEGPAAHLLYAIGELFGRAAVAGEEA